MPIQSRGAFSSSLHLQCLEDRITPNSYIWTGKVSDAWEDKDIWSCVGGLRNPNFTCPVPQARRY